MEEQDWLAERFEERRSLLKAVAYRMLGSLSEADDAVQEAWVRLSRTDEDIDNLDAWLTTVVARVCLNMLRARELRREQPMGPHVPDPIVDPEDGTSPEHEALLADSVGLALFVVLDTLKPAERLAFVLHDVFALPFDEIAPIVDRSPDAARQLASRARRRVRGAPVPDADRQAQREIVDAFFAAARDSDFERLLSVLDADVVLRSDHGALQPGASIEVHGAETVANRAHAYSRIDLVIRPALINGASGVVTTRNGELFSVGAFIVSGGRIVEIDFLADPERLSRLDLTALGSFR
jgi:RNA polymerase sigma factor (sigma-70 family)